MYCSDRLDCNETEYTSLLKQNEKFLPELQNDDRFHSVFSMLYTITIIKINS